MAAAWFPPHREPRQSWLNYGRELDQERFRGSFPRRAILLAVAGGNRAARGRNGPTATAFAVRQCGYAAAHARSREPAVLVFINLALRSDIHTAV